MAIEAKPRLQPQAVACAKADGHDLGHIQQADGKGFCLRHRQGNLKPILAGIARSADPQVTEHAHIHETHRRHLWHQPRQCGFGLRPLQRQKRAVGDRDHLANARQMRLHMGDVGLFTGGIDHHEHMVAPVGEHQIIKDPTFRVGEQPIALPPRLYPQNIHRHQRLERPRRVLIRPLWAQNHLPHVADIKQPSRRAGVQMLFHHPHRVLHGHGIARERHHLATQRDMQVIQTQ